MKQKGFTLIELLVVIAIIGILATIVLASLNTARVKANDVAVKSDLDNSRAAAELFYDTTGQGNQSYTNVCTLAQAGGINSMVTAAAVVSLGTGSTVTRNAVPSATQAVCNDSATQWAAVVPLKSDSTKSWCVDNTGASKQLSAYPATAVVVCP